MARTKTAATAPSGASAKTSRNGRLSNAERSAYFARREAAKVLRLVLRGDARRRAVGSIKSLVYSPSVKNKKATFALVCQTLKHLSIIKQVLDSASILNSKWKRQEELVYILTYDILFGQEISLVGDAEKFLMLHKGAIQSALARLLVRNKVKSIEDLMALYQTPDVPKPRYVRVNTLKMDVDSAVLELGKQFVVQKDDLVPDLLILPPGCDLHDHPLIVNGCVFLQGKASSMVAAALAPKPGWKVLDACSAPGNKTVHLAALMKGKGKIVACELNKERVRRLKDTIKLSGAANIEVLHGDFLNLDPKDPAYSEVRAILLDPSCSGSGTAAERLDHLLPSHASGHTADPTEMERLNKLSAFQKKALRHALSFPGVERVVYSTCSIHQVENEDVIKSVLPIAMSFGFQLATSFPQWNCRGLPVFEGSEHLLRTDPVEDKEGFFIALFVKGNIIDRSKNPTMPSSYNSK
ncbi:25S rRNA (cytosine-C(5))-methyltransferase NSUN5 [Citrus sinensis]|uniref:25S rRNA (Cytosine-C(5))-methyltransferase NSUN5 n=2 Tax=Citrus TaxID=2706 RepID=A0ACB8P5Z1_CITSI|nr:probable 28S rRNA (cytosine-C(5))-methyltransferase isoform X4 [Citrus x clementina]KAH9805160.1 25S rRNA (cytosine-C(5))-methyltransferase NSUN5 [Citrus sinensis]